ncbi:carbohydrate kinase family protein [Pedobacter cryoconitis]|uniref:Fructokinase n=1 Tax=Pedobacter cryoconitis TaxID=188932 RepID=A0A327TD20_9SPHI|nr:carbohydrate kinase [Pedobacter cryoconitis]RAJ35737.1 fructokinase [Pedobacter cryoconitis]
MITSAICFGEILWDVLPDGPQPGGAPLNVAYHLNKLGVSTSIISKIGNDENGEKLVNLLDNWGMNKKLLQRDASYPTSEVIARMGASNEVSYEIVFPVAWDFIDHHTEISNALTASTYFVYGSLASRNELSRKTLFKFLDSDSIKVLDINLRPPFFNKKLLEELMERADIIKFNESELHMAQILFGGSFKNEAEQVKFIQERFKIPEVIVTKGEFGASYHKSEDSYHGWGPVIEVNDTIGSGDSFLAAFIANHQRGIAPKTIIKNAIAMGAFIATKKGGCPKYKIEDYQNFITEIF